MPDFYQLVDPTVSRVYAPSKTVAWATGESALSPLRWNGTTWEVDYTLQLPGVVTALGGTANNDVWVYGGELRHHNGTAWARDPGITVPVRTFHGTAANNFWAGVNGGAFRYNGTTWVRANIPGSLFDILSISMTGTNDGWFVDGNGQIFRWNGTSFSQKNNTLGTSDPALRLFSWAADATHVWFGGPGILSYRP